MTDHDKSHTGPILKADKVISKGLLLEVLEDLIALLSIDVWMLLTSKRVESQTDEATFVFIATMIKMKDIEVSKRKKI